MFSPHTVTQGPGLQRERAAATEEVQAAEEALYSYIHKETYSFRGGAKLNIYYSSIYMLHRFGIELSDSADYVPYT
jgi:hypothetical protein